jgi:hypothetical protein
MALNLVLYAGDELGPLKIENELQFYNVQNGGYTTIVIGMFHIGNPAAAKDTQLGDIIFNGGNPILIRGGQLFYTCAPTWASQIKRLKTSSSVTKVYASFGGGSPVQDFATIQQIYQQNGNSFQGTMLQTNLQLFAQTFRGAFDGIDMDCEETYDVPSFVAFCEMLINLGFAITFCPYTMQSFWDTAQNKVQAAYPGAVKWWNLQCYDGGSGNNPQKWGQGLPNGFIIPGDWVRFWDPSSGGFIGDCPTDMTTLFQSFAGMSAVGGGFVYNLDLARDTVDNIPARGNGCGGTNENTPAVYRGVVQNALGG